HALRRHMASDDPELSGGMFDPPPYTWRYAYFPSWPDKPFLSVPPNTRKLWYGMLGIPMNPEDLSHNSIEVDSWGELLRVIVFAQRPGSRNGSNVAPKAPTENAMILPNGPKRLIGLSRRFLVFHHCLMAMSTRSYASVTRLFPGYAKSR